jgi:hypothetical protein
MIIVESVGPGAGLAAKPRTIFQQEKVMKNIKFVVKVNRGGLAPAFVQRTDRTPVQMTTNRKLALVMGKLTAEDAIKSIRNSIGVPELVPVQVAV